MTLYEISVQLIDIHAPTVRSPLVFAGGKRTLIWGSATITSLLFSFVTHDLCCFPKESINLWSVLFKI